MAFISLNGTEIKSPAECTWSLADVSSPNSGRTLDGIMHKDIVSQKRTLKCKWNACEWGIASQIIGYCKDQGVQIAVTYPDLMSGGMITEPFYTGDCTAKYHEWSEPRKIVEYISCDFIEV